MTEGFGAALREPLASKKRAEFIDHERYCATRRDDRAARRHLLQLFIALGQPEALPGASLTLAPGAQARRVAVLTPYFQESIELLERCHRSVREQTVACEHFMIADGFPRPEIDSWPVRHMRLPTPSRNFGDTPRRIAGEAAIEAGFDAVVYLDADNWFRPRHVESLFACYLAHGTPICHSSRTFHRVDGTLLPLMLRGDNTTHVDGNCVLVASEAFDLLGLWGTWPGELSCIDDRMFWNAALARGHLHGFTGALTMGYEASHVGFYRAAGEVPPAGVRPDLDLDRLFRWHAGLPAAERNDLDRRWGFSVTLLLGRLRGTPA